MSISEKINYLKTRDSITSDEIAKLSGVPVGTLNKILSGETKNPTGKTATRIAKVFNETAEYLLNDEIPTIKKSPAPEEPEAEDETRDELGIPRRAYDLFYQFLIDRGYVLKGDDVSTVQADFFAGLVQMVNAAFPARSVQIQTDEAV